MATVVVLAGPAAASHNQQQAEELWVTVGINAAGGDSLWVTDQTYSATRTWSGVAADVAIALGRRVGSFRAVDGDDDATVQLDDKLAQPDAGGALRWALDTAELQRVAENEGYEAVLLEVCTPSVGQDIDSSLAPDPTDAGSPGRRCREWYQPVDDPPLRATVQLFPDRNRYPQAVMRTLVPAAVAIIVLGIGATLLRRGPLPRRGVASWLLSIGSFGGAFSLGWGLTTFALWWSGAPADAMLIGGGGVGEQVGRTMLPGLMFLMPALLPGIILLTAPRREKPPAAPPAPLPTLAPSWTAPSSVHPVWPPGAGGPAPPSPPPPAPPAAPGSPSGWAPPR